jgi:dolichol-phosphate mannosyltransferase
LTVVVPAWNEAENLSLLLPALKGVIEAIGITAEIVVADGGSHDGTAEVARSAGARVVGQAGRGYGAGLLAGIEATTAPYIVTMDADLSHPPTFLDEFWRRRADADLVIASRYVPGGSADMGPVRRALSRILNRTYASVLSIPVADLSSGFRMYRREILTGAVFVARDFDILEEILIRAHQRGSRILEVPFHYLPRRSGRSHVRLFRFGWAYLRTLLRMYRLRWALARRGPPAVKRDAGAPREADRGRSGCAD